MPKKDLLQLESKFLRSIISQSGLSVTEAAKKLGISRPGLNNWLSSGRIPKSGVDALMVLAAFPDAISISEAAPVEVDGKKMVPDFIIKFSNKDAILVEVKSKKPTKMEIDQCKRYGASALVYPELGQIKSIRFGERNSTDTPVKKSSSIDLSKVSTNDLLNEIKRRLEK